jgi:hypothetical protein
MRISLETGVHYQWAQTKMHLEASEVDRLTANQSNEKS